MNRAAWAARFFFAVALVPTVVAASFAAYEFHTQVPPTYRQYAGDPLIGNQPSADDFLLGAYAPNPRHFAPDGLESRHAKSAALAKKAPPWETLAFQSFSAAAGCKAVVPLVVHPVNWRITPTSQLRELSLHPKKAKLGLSFPAAYVASAAGRGAETLIQLMPKGKHAASLSQIGNGEEDAVLQAFATEIKSFKDHVMISFAPEMNGTWYRYGYHMPGSKAAKKYPPTSPALYVTAYQHVHQVIEGIAGKYVSWFWQPSAIHKTLSASGAVVQTQSPAPYWPGNGEVDKIGLDGYYYYPRDSAQVIFGPTIDMLRAQHRGVPIMIGEAGAGLEPKLGFGVQLQVADIKNLFAGILKYRLEGLIWFDLNQLHVKVPPGQRRYKQDWKLEDSPRAQQVFQAAVANLASTYPIAVFAKLQQRSVC